MKATFPLMVLMLVLLVTGIVSAQVGGETGYFDIGSAPAGASVMFDGALRGTTPISIPVSTTGTPGHTILITRAGYEPWSQFYSGNPAEGQHIAVFATLVPIPVTPAPGSERGFYRVISDPPAATVVFDGVDYGLTPVTIGVSTTGTPGHTIAIYRAGYQTWSRSFPGNPAAGQTIDVSAILTPVAQTGHIYVNSVPDGSLAVLDNGLAELTTPGTFTDLIAGRHSIRVSRAGYQPFTTTVSVAAGETTTIMATLVPGGPTGSLYISSEPSGAALYVDAVYQGLTNQIVGNLAAGQHTVTLVKSGYRDSSATATVRSAETTSLAITLSPLVNPATGGIDVSSSPPGASVYLRGDYQGETSASGPLYLTALSPGTYGVMVKKSGYGDYVTTVQVTAGTIAQVAAILRPSSAASQSGSAEIFSSPSGADVYVNNVYKGITPLSLDTVPAAAYTVEVRLAGYTSYITSGVMNPGQNVIINAALTPLPVPTATKTPLSLVPVFAALAVTGFACSLFRKKR